MAPGSLSRLVRGIGNRARCSCRSGNDQHPGSGGRRRRGASGLFAEHAQRYPDKGWVEHDARELIANIRAGLDAVGDVDAIGIDNQGESCPAWDALTKEPISEVALSF